MKNEMLVNIEGKNPFRTTDTPEKRNFYKKNYGDKVRFEDPYKKLPEKENTPVVESHTPEQNNTVVEHNIEQQPERIIRQQRGRPPQKSDE